MKALVTGGGGFLGRAIVTALLARGNEVRVIGRNAYPDLTAQGVDCVQGDICDADAVNKACAGVDEVYHVAALAGYWGPWQEYYDINVLGTVHVIAACQHHNVGKLIYTSSPSVVVDGNEMAGVDETYPYPEKYLCHYSETKASAEKLILSANGKDGLLTASLRPHLIWGPGDNHLLPRLIMRAKSGKLRQVGDGENLVDHCYISNAADAHLLAADRLIAGSPVCGEAFFISQGEPVKLWAWVNEILTALNIPPVKKSISYKSAKKIGKILETLHGAMPFLGEPKMTRFLAMQLASTHYFDISKAKTLLNYQPAIGYQEGMEKLIADFK